MSGTKKRTRILWDEDELADLQSLIAWYNQDGYQTSSWAQWNDTAVELGSLKDGRTIRCASHLKARWKEMAHGTNGTRKREGCLELDEARVGKRTTVSAKFSAVENAAMLQLMQTETAAGHTFSNAAEWGTFTDLFNAKTGGSRTEGSVTQHWRLKASLGRETNDEWAQADEARGRVKSNFVFEEITVEHRSAVLKLLLDNVGAKLTGAQLAEKLGWTVGRVASVKMTIRRLTYKTNEDEEAVDDLFRNIIPKRRFSWNRDNTEMFRKELVVTRDPAIAGRKLQKAGAFVGADGFAFESRLAFLAKTDPVLRGVWNEWKASASKRMNWAAEPSSVHQDISNWLREMVLDESGKIKFRDIVEKGVLKYPHISATVFHERLMTLQRYAMADISSESTAINEATSVIKATSIASKFGTTKSQKGKSADSGSTTSGSSGLTKDAKRGVAVAGTSSTSKTIAGPSKSEVDNPVPLKRASASTEGGRDLKRHKASSSSSTPAVKKEYIVIDDDSD